MNSNFIDNKGRAWWGSGKGLEMLDLNKFSTSKNDLEETYEDLVSNMSHKTEDVISFLETKLADLKEQNAKLQN